MLLPIKQQAGAFPEKDFIHFVISPEKGQFEQLGETLKERLKAFKEVIRVAAQETANEASWIASIHLNTEIPHAHLAIGR